MRLKKFVFTTLTLLCFSALANAFTVIIDPGHGGSDPGAIGCKSKEKDLNLKVALLLGEKIEAECPDITVIYTRKSDQTLALKDRPRIANKNNGDFFISIHTNSAQSSKPCGTETFILGMAKEGANLEVAKRENSVILLEDDKESYQGFDPNKPESYILFEFLLDQYNEQSLLMADLIQQQFAKKTDRENRSVRQDLFWVLHQTKMPSVLVEIGFISNSSDENYLISKKGQNEIASAILEAIKQYKYEYDKKNNGKYQSLKTEISDNESPTYRVQLFAAKEELPCNHPSMKGEKNLTFFKENGYFKYTSQPVDDYEDAKKLHSALKEKFSDCFIIAFYKGEKISVKKALSIKK